MSLPNFLLGFRPGRPKTVQRVVLAALMVFLAAGPDELPAVSNARTRTHDSTHAGLPKRRPLPTQARRVARRPLTRQKLVITDQDILDQAQAAYIRGERQHAIDLATSIADKGGELAVPAWRFIGLAACSVRSTRLASRAYSNLTTADDQQALVRACQSNGLTLLNNQFIEH